MRRPLGLLGSWLGIVGYQSVGFLAMVATSLLAVVVIPPQVWGDYWVLLSLVQVVNGIGLSWISQSVLLFARDELRRRGDIRETLSTALVLQGLLLAALVVLGLLVWPLTASLLEISRSIFLLTLTAVALMGALETMSYALQADERFTGLGIGSALSKLGPLLAVAVVWAGLSASPQLLLVGLAGGLAAGLAATVRAMPPATGNEALPSLTAAWSIVSYGRSLPVAIAAGVMSAWMHVWFVKAYGGAAEAGVYAWAASLYALASAALMPMSAVIAPHLMDLVLANERDRARQRTALFTAVTVLAAIAAPAALAGLRLLSAALPDRYSGAGPILVVLLAAVPAQVLTYLCSPLLRAFPHMMGRVVTINMLMAALNVVLNFVLTPKLGGIGAAASLVSSVWAAALLAEHYTRQAVDGAQTGKQTLVLLSTAAISLTAAILAISLPALAAGPVGLAVSGLLLVAARRFGLLQPLSIFVHHLNILPQPLRNALTGFLLWCDTGRRTSRRGGTVS